MSMYPRFPLHRAGLTLTVALGLASGSAFAAVSARLDQDRVSEGDSVQLVLERDDRGGGNPDLSPLHRDFDVLATSRGTSIRFVNGSLSQQQQVQVSLAPKHAGHLRIPPLAWGSDTTAAIDLDVAAGGGSAPAGGDVASAEPHVFLSSVLEPPQPYVQGAATLTVTLHTDLPLKDASLQFAGSDEVAVQPIGKDRSSVETRNGRRYQIIERSYQLTPLRSGALSLAGPTLEAQVPDARRRTPFDDDDLFARAFGGQSPFAGLVGGLRPLRVHGKDVQLEARPRPAAAAGPDWLPARALAITGAWQPDAGPVRAGEPLTLHLRLSAKGLSAAQLPDLASRLQLPDGLRAYPDPAKLETAGDGAGVTGTRDQDIAIIASRPGHYRIPALRLPWWDTTADAAREALLPAREVTIEAGAVAAGPAAAAPPAMAVPAPASADAEVPTPSAVTAPVPPLPPVLPASRWWLPVIAALVVLWLGTVALWWRELRRPAREANAAPARAAAPARDGGGGVPLRRFRDACRADDPAATREALLEWGRGRWPETAPSGLGALAARFGDPALRGLLMELDRAVYTASSWRGAALVAAFRPETAASAAVAGRAPPLGPLYGR